MSNFTDAINAIDEKIQHHSGEAQKAREDIARHTTHIARASTLLDVQSSTVDSLKAARKILTDAELASRNDNPTGNTDDDPFIL